MIFSLEESLHKQSISVTFNSNANAVVFQQTPCRLSMNKLTSMTDDYNKRKIETRQ